jgi:hypothetical protein
VSIIPDYRPEPAEIGDYETLFGDLLSAGHTVQESAGFLVQLGNGDVDDSWFRP